MQLKQRLINFSPLIPLLPINFSVSAFVFFRCTFLANSYPFMLSKRKQRLCMWGNKIIGVLKKDLN